MKKLLQSLFVLGVFGSAALCAQAQSTTKILFVDMAKLFDGHYRKIEEMAKLQADGQKAQAQLDQMNKEGNALVAQYKELEEQSNNPTATAEAKAKVLTAAQQKMQEINAKQLEFNKFHDNAARELQQRRQEIQTMVMEEISKIASDVAKRDGATLLIDKAGPSLSGLPVAIYSDPSADITPEVAAEIVKTRPLPIPAAPTPAPVVAPKS